MSGVRGFTLLQGALLVVAALLGVLAAAQPTIALAAAAGAVIAYIVFSDLALGFAGLAALSFLEILPTSGSLSPAKALGLLLALAWLARFSLSDRGERDFFADHPQLAWLLAAFIGWAVLSLLWASDISPGLTALSRYVPNMLLLPIAYTAVRRRRDVTVVMAAILLGAIIAAAWGVVQPPNPEVIEAKRAAGTVGDPNEFAAALLVGIGIGAGLALARGLPAMLRIAGLAAIPLCALGIFLSVSRGGLVALAVMLTAATVLAGRWRIAAATLLAAFAVGGVVYFTQFAPLPSRERIVTSNGGSGRSDLWKVGMRMVRAHPVGGVGVGNFSTVSPKYVIQAGSLTRTDLIFTPEPFPPHNIYLEVLAEMGVPGLLLFLGILGTCLRCALRAARIAARAGNLRIEAVARAILLSTLGLLVAEFFISAIYSKLLWTMLALGPVILAVARAERTAPLARGAEALAAGPLE